MASKDETLFRKRVVSWIKSNLSKAVVLTIQQISLVGYPDLVLCLNGYFIAIELKKEGGKATDLQLYQLQMIVERGGGISMVVDPENWHLAQAVLHTINQREPAWANPNQHCLSLQ